jgi:hypothetical protein
MKRKQTPEAALQRLVLDWLAAKHIFAIRCNSGTLINQAGRPVTFGVPGMADILAFQQPMECPYDVSHQRVCWIELKAPKGKQSEFQRSFQAKVESEGHKYLLIKDLSELEAQL